MPFKIYWAVLRTQNKLDFRPIFLPLEFLGSRNMVKIDHNGSSAHYSWGVGIETHWETQEPLLISHFLPMEPWFCSKAQRKGPFQLQEMNPGESKVRVYANNRNYLYFATI